MPNIFYEQSRDIYESDYPIFLYQFGAFPVQRGVFDRRALQQARRILNAGHILGMFPEGTRTYGNGMVSAKSGTAYLAIQGKCPVIPVAIDGAQNILENIFKKTQVKINICTQIFPIEETNPQSLTK